MAFGKECGANNMYGICRIQKYKNDTIRGIENHLERRNTTTNPDINKSRSKTNYDLTNNEKATLKSLIKKRLEEVGITKQRKNAVTMVEFLFTASHEFFKDMSSKEIRQYFEKCYAFACKKYGKENIIAADVHLDEKTPHMHLELIPIHKNKLDARSLFNHKLEELQNQVHEQVFSKYGLERGDSHKDVKHISTLNYKALTLQAEIDEKKKELEKLNNKQLFKMKNHLKALSDRLQEMMTVIESNEDLMQEYLKSRDNFFKQREEEQQNEKEI